MRVLTDYHHGGLYGSLHKLFVERLGFELYRPIGIDWFEGGWWQVAAPYGHAKDTINQYLAIDNRPWHPYEYLNGNRKQVGEVYHIYDPENAITHRAITLETFKEMQFDLVIATHPLHEFWVGLLKHQPNAKFIMQLGNENQTTVAKNVMSSVWAYKPQAEQNVFYYHQEFPMDHLGWEDPQTHTSITSMVHLLPCPEIYDRYKSILPDFTFKAYGMSCPDGIPGTKDELGKIMKSTAFGWHIKPADGYGHLIHQWYACGRPVITKGDYYFGKTGGLLLTDGETCIDLDKHSEKENCDLIRYWSHPDNHIRMCKNAYARFKEVVNFDDEAQRFTEWIKTIV